MKHIGGWLKSFRGKVTGIAILIILAALVMQVTNGHTLSTAREAPARMTKLVEGETLVAQMVADITNLVHVDFGLENQTRHRLRRSMEQVEERFDTLLRGNQALGITPISDKETLASLQNSENLWDDEIKPDIDVFLNLGSRESAKARADSLLSSLERLASNVRRNVNAQQEILNDAVDTAGLIQILGFALILVVLAGGYWLIAGIIRTVETTTTALASASSELLAVTQQQASTVKEQAASVSETVSTVEEIQQTSEQAAGRAKEVSDASERASEVGAEGQSAIDASIARMEEMQKQTNRIAENILDLSQRAQAIGEIIASVNEIAEQTNLLALNAGIEAARAGEHGGGFSVVAREIKDLAGQAKKATGEVRNILMEIQRATNSTVMVTEEGAKSADATIEAIRNAGDTIRSLKENIDETMIAAQQIAASSAQQATGITQIQQAMRDIDEATNQTTAATSQTERAAQDLNDLGQRLKALLGT
ncbi:methyl-accepting chemotaxis protein [Limibacillus sp. MBR-115]|jgi:methyl-accepting chemotaxis protein|uniref:methyl-accepting chemotaxis protein n=1 Tax=Limibacillus sp. MBR-115 TaxID=3156465 RepID=UPI00339B4F8B